MNKSPLNHLITIALGAIIWVVTAVLYGPNFCESLSLATLAPEEVLPKLQIFLGIGAGFGILFSVIWFIYGNRDKVTGNLKAAKNVWWLFFVLNILVAVINTCVMIFLFTGEGIETKHYIILFALLSLHTFILFWLFTFLMSPKPVKYIPLFK